MGKRWKQPLIVKEYIIMEHILVYFQKKCQVSRAKHGLPLTAARA